MKGLSFLRKQEYVKKDQHGTVVPMFEKKQPPLHIKLFSTSHKGGRHVKTTQE